MKNKINNFVRICEGEKVALIDPVGKVCLGVSKQLADNIDKDEIQSKLYQAWKQQATISKRLEESHEYINTAYLIITRQCNMHCDFCAINANDNFCFEKEFRLEDIKNKVVPFFKKNKPHKLIISGGEPLIKEQIVKIIKVLREGVECPIILQSNGLDVTSEIAQEIGHNINEIDFSTKHMFESEEREQQLLKNIEVFRKVGTQVVLSFIYEKTNEKDLYKLIDIAAKYNINVIFNIVFSIGRAKEKSPILTEVEHIDMNLKIAKYILMKGYENKEIANGFHQRIQVRSSCGGYGKVMAVYPEGDIYMCQCIEKEHVKMGNILFDSEQTIMDNLTGLLNSKEIKQMFCVDHKEECRDCEYRYICGGKCAASEGTSDYKCEMAKAMLNYELFYYNPQCDKKKSLVKYVEYMEKYKLKAIQAKKNVI